MELSHLTEDEMAEVKKEVLERLRPYLVDKLIAERHYDYLRSRKILTREDAEEINCKCTRSKRAGKLLDLISENPRGLDTLLESIQRCGTLNFIIARITDEVQRVKNEKLEALRAVGMSSSMLKGGASNDLSKVEFYDYDKCSTFCLHPDGERSPSSSSVHSSSMNLSCGLSRQKGQDWTSFGGAAASLNVSSTQSCLPKPGDPGAPPLPDDLNTEASDAEAGACGSTGTSGDANFLPLRSRSLNLSIDDVL